MSPFCAQACVICDVDGFNGRNGRDDNYELPDDFCTLQQHNGKWIAFVAGSEDLAIRMSVENCQQGDGLEIAIYEALDCENFRLVSNCFGGFGLIRPGSSGIFRNTEPLVVGQHYYIVMDGGRDDVCDWAFSVEAGTTELAPLAPTGDIFGPGIICPDVANLYTIVEQDGATEYSWSLDNQPVGRDPVLELTVPTAGAYELCVTARNACNSSNTSCRTVVARTIPDQTLDRFLCVGDTLLFADSAIVAGGVYAFNFVTALGCDSNIVVNVTEVPSSLETVAAFICSDDTLRFNGAEFTETGVYETILRNRFGCDSTLRLDLTVIECNIVAEGARTQVQCNGSGNGVFTFSVTNGTPLFTYVLNPLGGATVSQGRITNLNEQRSIENLGPGTYQVTIDDEFGNTRILNVVIEEPDPIMVNPIITDHAGFAVSCFGDTDGEFRLDVSGGTGPYDVVWNTLPAGPAQSALPAGEYFYELTDARNCFSSGSVLLTEPTEITPDYVLTDPGCAGPLTGSIALGNPTGGAGGYRFHLAGRSELLAPPAALDSLGGGEYTLYLEDANGCGVETPAELTAALIPQVELGNQLNVALGDIFTVPLGPFNVDSFFFTAGPGLIPDSLTDRPRYQAINSDWFYLTAVSADGCTVSDSLFVTVVKERRVYPPTAFSPNGDGVNDVFRLGTGDDVVSVGNLRVYDRWGGEVFAGPPASVTDVGWDGGEAPTGTYLWSAEVVFLDGVVRELYGNVVLLR